MKESLASKALKIALYAIFALGVLGTVTLPWFLDYYTGYFYDAYYLQPGYRRFILSFLIVVALICLWILGELIGMMRSIPTDPFVARNVRALRRVGILAVVLAALFFAKCLYYLTFLTLACGFLFVVGALFLFTMCNLFRQAVTFKQENDLTI